MIYYPIVLKKIFEKLFLFDINPIIVGGFVRDTLLGTSSKDIDIELYGTDSMEHIEEILAPFGSLCSVGKSFGVSKLKYKGYDLDFSLPRRENKIANGHKGFEVIADKNLDFKTASMRRDFTINAIGFDVKREILLDPFFGINDLNAKILRAVSLEHFDEDPLRILRCVQFASRFTLDIEERLFLHCKDMIQKRMLQELPRERIFTEFSKLLLKSHTPSKGLWLLNDLGAFIFFEELQTLLDEEKKNIFKSLDFLALIESENLQERLTIMLALLCQNFSKTQRDSFLARLTKENRLINSITNLLQVFQKSPIKELSDYEIYTLAKTIDIRIFLLFVEAWSHNTMSELVQKIEKRARELNVYERALSPMIKGKDLIFLGLRPSKEFSQILNFAYEAQMHKLFATKEEALEWLKLEIL